MLLFGDIFYERLRFSSNFDLYYPGSLYMHNIVFNLDTLSVELTIEQWMKQLNSEKV